MGGCAGSKVPSKEIPKAEDNANAHKTEEPANHNKQA